MTDLESLSSRLNSMREQLEQLMERL